MNETIGDLMRRATALRREILIAAVLIVAVDSVAATECIKLIAHPTVRMGFALAIAVLAVVGSSAFGLRLERELVRVVARVQAICRDT